jgi:hypothetical protein
MAMKKPGSPPTSIRLGPSTTVPETVWASWLATAETSGPGLIDGALVNRPVQPVRLKLHVVKSVHANHVSERQVPRGHYPHVTEH